MNITIKVPKTNPIRYPTPPFSASINIVGEQKMNHVSFKYINLYKQTIESRIIIIIKR